MRLVAARGKYMQEAAVATPSGMVAILGADSAEQVDKIVADAKGGDVLDAGELQRAGSDRRQRQHSPRASRAHQGRRSRRL